MYLSPPPSSFHLIILFLLSCQFRGIPIQNHHIIHEYHVLVLICVTVLCGVWVCELWFYSGNELANHYYSSARIRLERCFFNFFLSSTPCIIPTYELITTLPQILSSLVPYLVLERKIASSVACFLAFHKEDGTYAHIGWTYQQSTPFTKPLHTPLLFATFSLLGE